MQALPADRAPRPIRDMVSCQEYLCILRRTLGNPYRGTKGKGDTMMKHCFHRTGTIFPMNPALYEVQCCWCGMLAKDRPHLASNWLHGEFAPKKWNYAVDEDGDECPERDSE